MSANLYTPGVRIDGTDVGPLILEGGTIEYGRQSVFDQPGASICELTLFTYDGYPQAPKAWFEFGVGEYGGVSGFVDAYEDTYAGPVARLNLNAPVWVSATTPPGFVEEYDDTYTGAEFRRFTGRIQAIQYDVDRIHITATDDLERWARVGILAEPDPAPDTSDQTDVDRVEWLADQTPAPTTLHVRGTGYAVLTEIAAEDYPICLLDALQAIAADCDAVVYCDREGRVTYRTYGDREHLDPGPTIPPEIVEWDSVSMELNLGMVENVVRVEYGAADARDAVTRTDSDSVDLYGPRVGYYETQLLNYGDADIHARKIAASLSAAWDMPDATLLMNLATNAQVEDLMALDIGDVVTFDTLPSGAPVTSICTEILGYTEYLSADEWAIDLHLAHYTDTGGS